MLDVPPHHLQAVPNQPPGCGRWAQMAKKILNRRNEPKDLLKIRELAFSEAENELFVKSKKPQTKRKISPTFDECGTEEQVSGVRSQNEAHLLPEFCLLLTADCLLPLKGVRVGGPLGPRRSPRQDVASGGERGCSNFKNRKNNTRMSLKTKDRLSAIRS